MRNIPRILLLTLCLGFLPELIFASDPDAPVIRAGEFKSVPVIDGVMDLVWEALPWNSLNFVWMDWEETVDSADYYGRFKVAWSGETDLLYFFVEITDDILIELFSEMLHTNHYNDVIEVFIDEDNSGGLHVFDGDGSWGTNAENAFSYHLTPLDTPMEGYPVTDFTVADLDGTSWADSFGPEYISHFPEAILIFDGEKYYWEFSLVVYKDTYEADNEAGSRAELVLNKEIGLALAYCETDNTAVYMREMFFGTYEGDPAKLDIAEGDNYGYNEAWKDASDYNLLVLAEELTPGTVWPVRTGDNIGNLSVMRSIDPEAVKLRYTSNYLGEVEIEYYDLMGRLLFSSIIKKSDTQFDELVKTGNLGPGLIRITEDERSAACRIL